MIKINDIKPIVEIPDASIYILYALIFASLILACFIIYFVYNFFKPKKKTDEKIYYEKLKALDFIDMKQTAYDISKYGRLLAKEEREIRLIDELHEELSCFKYQKNISSTFPKEIRSKFTIFMDTLDVR